MRRTVTTKFLAYAISEFGLGPEHVHDPFNIFMTTGVNTEGRPFYLPSDSKKGDFVELVAEINCIVAISACPRRFKRTQNAIPLPCRSTLMIHRERRSNVA